MNNLYNDYEFVYMYAMVPASMCVRYQPVRVTSACVCHYVNVSICVRDYVNLLSVRSYEGFTKCMRLCECQYVCNYMNVLCVRLYVCVNMSAIICVSICVRLGRYLTGCVIILMCYRVCDYACLICLCDCVCQYACTIMLVYQYVCEIMIMCCVCDYEGVSIYVCDQYACALMLM